MQITEEEKNTLLLTAFSFSPEARELYKKWFTNPQNQRMMGFIDNTFDDTDIDRWKESVEKSTSQIMYNIILTPSKQLIGMCSMTLLPDNLTGELEILIGEKKYRNQGLGTVAIQLLLNDCFERLDLKKVIVKVYADNIAAIKCYKKIGFCQVDYFANQDTDILILEKVKKYSM